MDGQNQLIEGLKFVDTGVSQQYAPVQQPNYHAPVIDQRWILEEKKTQEVLYREQVKARIHTNEQRDRNEIFEAHLKNLEDIRKESALQRQIILTDENGSIRLQQETFGKDIKGDLKYALVSSLIYCNSADLAQQILSAEVSAYGRSDKISLWLDLGSMQEKNILKAFRRARINFGFKRAKELDVCCAVLNFMLQCAAEIVVPETHGWYEMEGELFYAFPDDITWQEVFANARI